jgi:group II intron reverse transcriptase/maturase
LAHLIDERALRRSYERLRSDAAVGVDGVSKAEYGEKLGERLKELHERLKSFRWRHQALRRVEIPKEDGKRRPIGISTVEDKVVQGALREVLEAVYEQDFFDCSYGFRPKRSAHDALRAIDRAAWEGWESVVLEADIAAFFDSADRTALLEMMRERVPDGALLRLVQRCLRAGVMEGGESRETEEGTPQGSSLSPLLANIYLHHVLDVWFEEQVKPRLKGRARLVRYCDDFVMLFEEARDAERVMEVLPKRMGKYNLKLHGDKTRLLRFEKPSPKQPKGKGPATVEFLGFTMYWGRTHGKTWQLRYKTRPKSLRRSLHKTDEWCRRSRILRVKEQYAGLVRRMVGHYNYFGVNGNIASLQRYEKRVQIQWRKWLNRRSQRGRMTWSRYYGLLKSYPLPEPRICVHIWG